ncbi:hypothetical protein TraAM80_05996 [Trypanosoma rangeli]|uniref:Uncharacterized protein n=1 Tax=Trypanosoma rangeli TaxID=5698 RepID=A0A422NCC8_TRYRA|nr:uncharacterized protein TraAM80_05996 [Trypanosoma rangeli]RNF03138.1 hypothetical protein TraAM80_05996 [Trypanosoma rangeli]|eukprot:RNF03138.1 hypothetical protein TraAM80_05996 [Trypanosoma rangeli]
MTGKLQGSRGVPRACWKQMLSEKFGDNPDERLKLYGSLARLARDKNAPYSDSWTAVMLKASHDSWSRIRQLGRETLLREVKMEVELSNKNFSRRVLSLLLSKWPQMKCWYEREGFLLLLLGFFLSKADVISDGRVLSYILLRVGLPSLLDPQLPVREVAVNVTVQIAELSGDLASFTQDHLLIQLKLLLEERKEPSACEIEGLLSGVTRLMVVCPSTLHTEWWAKMQPLLQQLSVHSAASVRQRVAAVWAPLSVRSFEMLCIAIIKKSESPSESDEWWRMVEVLLMALQEQLAHLLTLTDGEVTVDLETRGASIADSLYAVLMFAEMQRFEVMRMGKQLVPLLTQFWVRFAPSLDFVEACCGQVERRFLERAHFLRLFLPELIWFLALRRYLRPAEDVERVRDAVSQHLLPLLHGKWNVFLNSNDIGTVLPRPGYALAVLLLVTYFPDCLTKSVNRDLMTFALSEGAWKRALSEDIDSVRYGVDFALSVRRIGGTILHLVPVWLEWISNAYAHQQCLILEAVKIAVGSPKYWVSSKPFSFAYCSVFDAPTMQEGGEEVSRGFYWLKLHCPTPACLPEIPFLSADAAGAAGVVPAAVHETVYASVYVSKGTEHSVLRIARSLMLTECEANRKAESIAAVVAAVVARLENVSPRWREALPVSFGGAPGVPDCRAQGGIRDKHSGCSDWDDSEGGLDAEGVDTDEEIREAGRLFAVILGSCFGADVGGFLRAVGPAERQSAALLLNEFEGGCRVTR